ncbi:MAG: type II secretion system protein GspD [Gemmatimonadaceae bacterium]
MSSIRRWSIPRASALLLAIILSACASSGATRPVVHSSAHVEPQGVPSPVAVDATPADPGTAPPLPRMAGANAPAMSSLPEQRISSLDVPAGTPIATAVSQLGAKLGWSVSIDPDVRGTAQASLKNVTVDAALNELVTRNGYGYQLQGTVLRVVPIRMQTKNFRLDYVAISRVGTMSTVVQRRLSNSLNNPSVQIGSATGLSTQSAGVGALGASGADVLTAQSVADIWQEIRVAITGILQAGQPQARAATADQTTAGFGQTGFGMIGAGATTASFADGSTVVISPISGLINVTAMPDKLRDVEAFLNDFQASVLRQVMIEAKIVEVTLNKTFQFGIDWNVVNAAGKTAFSLHNDATTQTTGNAGNVTFSLNGGSTQINAVLNALESQGAVAVLSNEKTTALNNQRAIFNVTTDEVFFSVTRTPLLGPNGAVISIENQVIPQQISVGVVLDVLPQISADNILTMDIRPAVTSIARVDSITLADGTSTSAPVIARREGDTIARLRAGETMVIGGLVQTRKENTVGGIPWLKDIPLIGTLFKQINLTDARSELVVFLTPTILSGQPSLGGGR